MNSSTWTVRCAACVFLLAAGSLPAAAGDVAGTWNGVFELAGQTREYSFELTRDGEAVQGSMVSPRSKNRYPVEEGSFKDSTLRITVKHSQGQVRIVAKLDGDRLEGTCEVAGTGSAKFTAKRGAGAPKAEGKAGALQGTWKVTAKADEREMQSDMEIVEKDGKLSGTIRSERGSTDLRELKLLDGKFTARIVLQRSSGEFQIDLEAVFDGPDRLKGTWKTGGDEATGPWEARRVAEALPGAWKVTAKVGDREMQLEMEIVGKDGILSGTVRGERGPTDLREPRLQAGKFTAHILMQRSSEEIRIDLEAVFDGPDRLKGTWKRLGGDEATGDFEARRAAGAPEPAAVPLKLQARYLVEAVQPDGQVFRVFLEPRIDGERLGGAMILENGEKVELRSGAARDGRFECEVKFPFRGEEMTVRITGSLQGKGLLEGTWWTDGGSGSWTGKPAAEL